jgi:hypothetical protein
LTTGIVEHDDTMTRSISDAGTSLPASAMATASRAIVHVFSPGPHQVRCRMRVSAISAARSSVIGNRQCAKNVSLSTMSRG